MQRGFLHADKRPGSARSPLSQRASAPGTGVDALSECDTP